MKKTLRFFVFMSVLLLIGGVVAYQQFILADYTYTGDGKNLSDVFHGKISFTGNRNEVTIRAGSDVEWVTILGNENTIRIEEGAHVAQVRGLGSNNTVDAPPDMEIDLTRLKGDNNRQKQPVAPSLDGL